MKVTFGNPAMLDGQFNILKFFLMSIRRVKPRTPEVAASCGDDVPQAFCARSLPVPADCSSVDANRCPRSLLLASCSLANALSA